MKNRQIGFGVVEMLVLIVVVGLIGALGWYALQQQVDENTPNETTSQVTSDSLVEYVDSTESFSFKYPDGWSVEPYETPGYDGPERPEPDWTQTSQPITLRNQSNKDAVIMIEGDVDANATVQDEMAAIDKDQFNTYTEVVINGYDAIKHILDFVGPSDAEKYKDTRYIVLADDGSKVTFYFRERYSNNTLDGEDDFDASDLVSDFEGVVNSIQFLD